MISATAPAEKGAIDPRAAAGLWLRHLVSLFFPGLSLAFLWTGPHRWYVAALFMLPLVAAHQLDCAARVERRQPEESLPAWPFDLLVYTLAGLQFLVVFELARLFSVQGFFSVDMVMVFLVVGSSSGFSIVTAHELIHRRKPWEQRLGRLLLCSVLYEHFFTEHRRGHHVRVGTPEDPATACCTVWSSSGGWPGRSSSPSAAPRSSPSCSRRSPQCGCSRPSTPSSTGG